MSRLTCKPLELINHLVIPGSCNNGFKPKRPLVFLPAFQRDAVWNPAQVCEFWGSLLRGIPLPSLILSRVCSDNVAIAAKSDTNERTPSKGDFWLLDGQQRARALLAAGYRITDGKGQITQHLWIDLDWPHKTDPADDRLDDQGMRFGFFLCTRAWPWGHSKSRNDKPDRSKIAAARKTLY